MKSQEKKGRERNPIRENKGQATRSGPLAISSTYYIE